MKYRIVLGIAAGLLLLIIVKSFTGGKEEVAITSPTRTPKIIQTEIVGKSTFTEQVHVTGRVAPTREAVVSTQGTWFIGSINAEIGDTVGAGETLASIADTYGLSGNAIEEANIGVESASITRDNTIASLEQALESARVAYERAGKDYDASKLSDGKSKTPSKAELDLQNYITTQEKTLSGYETSYQAQLQSFQSFLANVIDTSDSLVGVSDAKRNQNDTFEYLLGALDSTKKSKAETSIQKLLPYKTWTPDPNVSLIERVQELQRVYLIANEVLTNVENLLINSVVDSTNFTATTMATHRATIDGLQTQYSSISTGLVTFLNTAQTFLATYEKERQSREQAVQTTAENSLSAYELAKKAYETAQTARDLGIAQLDQWMGSASVKLQNAQGNAAKMSIAAPFSGVIIAKNIEIGSLVSPGANIFTIGDISSLIVKTETTVEQKKYLKVGQEVSLTFGDEIFIGRLSAVGAGPDPVTRLYKIEITLQKTHPKLSPGDIVDVILPGAPLSKNPEDTKIVIPYSALKNLWQETYAVYIFTLADSKKWTGIIHERVVKIGDTNETSVTIVDGLSVGEYIVTLWTLGVDEGDYAQDLSLIEAIDPLEESKNI